MQHSKTDQQQRSEIAVETHRTRDVSNGFYATLFRSALHDFLGNQTVQSGEKRGKSLGARTLRRWHSVRKSTAEEEKEEADCPVDESERSRLVDGLDRNASEPAG